VLVQTAARGFPTLRTTLEVLVQTAVSVSGVVEPPPAMKFLVNVAAVVHVATSILPILRTRTEVLVHVADMVLLMVRLRAEVLVQVAVSTLARVAMRENAEVLVQVARIVLATLRISVDEVVHVAVSVLGLVTPPLDAKGLPIHTAFLIG